MLGPGVVVDRVPLRADLRQLAPGVLGREAAWRNDDDVAEEGMENDVNAML